MSEVSQKKGLVGPILVGVIAIFFAVTAWFFFSVSDRTNTAKNLLSEMSFAPENTQLFYKIGVKDVYSQEFIDKYIDLMIGQMNDLKETKKIEEALGIKIDAETIKKSLPTDLWIALRIDPEAITSGKKFGSDSFDLAIKMAFSSSNTLLIKLQEKLKIQSFDRLVQEPYKKSIIYSANSKTHPEIEKMAFSFHDSYLFVSTNKDHLKQVLMNHDENLPKMLKNPRFKAANERFNFSRLSALFMFVDLQESFKPLLLQDKKLSKTAASYIKDLEYFFYGGYNTSNIMLQEGFLSILQNSENKWFDKIYAGFKDRPFHSLLNTHQDTDVFFAFNIKPFYDAYLDLAKNNPSAFPTHQHTLSKIDEAVKMIDGTYSHSTLFDTLLSGEFSFFITNILDLKKLDFQKIKKTANPFEDEDFKQFAGNIGIGIGLKDSKNFETKIHQNPLFKQASPLLKTSKHQEVTYYSHSLPPHEALYFSYQNNNLTFTMSDKFMKNMIDLSVSKKSLNQSELYQISTMLLPDTEVFFLTYMNAAHIFDVYADLTDKAYQFLSQQSAPARSSPEVQQMKNLSTLYRSLMKEYGKGIFGTGLQKDGVYWFGKIEMIKK